MVVNRNVIIIAAVVVFILWFVSMLLIFRKGKDTQPLIEARVPPETIAFLSNFVNSFDIKLIYNPNPTKDDWRNELNFGEDKESGLKKLEDEYFIIYFDDNPEEKNKAIKSLGYAREAIPELIKLMGTYFFPADVYDRKLPIYLASSEEWYNRIFQSLLNTNRNAPGNTAGLYISTYSYMGNVTKGIILHPLVWERASIRDYPKQVLWHEMNHYVFFTAIHYDKIVKPFTWVYEGLAEYFSKPEIPSLNNSNAIYCQTLSLSAEFLDRRSNYWAGQTVYQFFENHYSFEDLKMFVYYSYSSTTNDALYSAFSDSPGNIEKAWHNYAYLLATPSN